VVAVGYQQTGKLWKKPIVIVVMEECFFLVHPKLLMELKIVRHDEDVAADLRKANTHINGISVATSKEPFSGDF